EHPRAVPAALGRLHLEDRHPEDVVDVAVGVDRGVEPVRRPAPDLLVHARRAELAPGVDEHEADVRPERRHVREGAHERDAVVDSTGPLAERVERFVEQRARLLEAITPIRRAAAVHAPFSAEITQRIHSGHQYLRYETERAFRPELDALTGAARVELLDALD